MVTKFSEDELYSEIYLLSCEFINEVGNTAKKYHENQKYEARWKISGYEIKYSGKFRPSIHLVSTLVTDTQ